MKIEVFVLVKERFGEDYAKKLFEEAAARLLTEKFTEMKHKG